MAIRRPRERRGRLVPGVVRRAELGDLHEGRGRQRVDMVGGAGEEEREALVVVASHGPMKGLVAVEQSELLRAFRGRHQGLPDLERTVRQSLVWRKVVRIEMLSRSQNSCSRGVAIDLYVWDTYKHTYHKEAVLQIEVNERERERERDAYANRPCSE